MTLVNGFIHRKRALPPQHDGLVALPSHDQPDPRMLDQAGQQCGVQHRDVAQVVSLCFEMRWPNSTMVSATDGSEGISLTEIERPDVIILDFDLSDRNGLEVCRTISHTSTTYKRESRSA